MSQAKVDKHKQEKYNRKKNVKKRNFKKIAAYVVATLIAIAFIGYIGYSVAIDTGLYTPATTTQGSTLSKEAIESLRQQLIKNGDSNVQGETSDALSGALNPNKSMHCSSTLIVRLINAMYPAFLV